MKATNVRALDEHKIEVTFLDGVSGIIDLSDLVEQGIFQQLKDDASFRNVHTDGAAIIWSEELEIDADNIYAEILSEDPIQVLHTPLYHAAD